MNDVSIVVCGEAGQGIQTVEEFLVYLFKNSGYNVFATKEYMSRVRGGINATEIRVSSQRISAYVHKIDLFVPLHINAMKHVHHRLSRKTKIFADPKTLDNEYALNKENIILFDIFDNANKIGGKIYANIIAVGFVAGIFSIQNKLADKFISGKFSEKGKNFVKNDLEAYNTGNKFGQQIRSEGKLIFDINSNPHVIKELIFPGTSAIGLGAIAGGCNFISAYPMSPSTGVLVFLAQNSKEHGIIIDQAEDEIAAVNKAIGAWYAGGRALVSTSGGGFSLMGEGISLAGMIESPLVIHIAQRPGPATGLPTRTAQEDLNLALYAGHGEFPRIIYAPGTLQHAFTLTQKAFNVADKFQIPVFILTDHYFVDSYYNIPEFKITDIDVDHNFIKTDKSYIRYKYTETGFSPRGIPGYGDGLVRVDSDEHDEFGHITEDLLNTRKKMVEKRLLQKMKLIKNEIIEPELIGSKDYKILIICWGSNYHVVKEAVANLNRNDIAMLHYSQVFPLHSKTKEYLSYAIVKIILENNFSGQFANLIKLETGIDIPSENRKLKFTGEPFSVEEVVEFIKLKIQEVC